MLHGDVNNLASQTVFNAEQVAGPGVGRYLVTQIGKRPPAFDTADKVIAATGADIRHESRNGALYYRLPLDYIVLPFEGCNLKAGPYGVPPYYVTIFHELGHFSEHRLHWLADPHLSIRERYWIGEMRAVFCASILAAEIGIPDIVKEKERFLPRWIELMQADNTLVFRVASAASEAAEFIMSFSQQQKLTA